jgi:hypothetical protein
MDKARGIRWVRMVGDVSRYGRRVGLNSIGIYTTRNNWCAVPNLKAFAVGTPEGLCSIDQGCPAQPGYPGIVCENRSQPCRGCAANQTRVALSAEPVQGSVARAPLSQGSPTFVRQPWAGLHNAFSVEERPDRRSLEAGSCFDTDGLNFDLRRVLKAFENVDAAGRETCEQMSMYGRNSGNSRHSVGWRAEQVWHVGGSSVPPRFTTARAS